MSNDSEFICHVVRVLSVEKHPNADRLGLVTISLDGTTPYQYKIINSLGQFAAGDTAVYVGPDAVVPITEGSPFRFLSERLDAKGKTRYRVRAARIRGLYSPGLLVGVLSTGAEGQAVGTDVSAALGVTNWSDDNEATASAKSGQSAMSKMRAKDIYPVYGVTNLKKVPNLFTEDDDVIITEKIHGTNFRFGYGGRPRFYYGTHRTNLSDNRGWFTRFTDYWFRGLSRTNRKPGFDNVWAAAVTGMDLQRRCKEAPEYIFYGELFGSGPGGKAIQPGFNYGFKSLQLQIFDVYYPEMSAWLSPEEVQWLCADMDFPTVVTVYAGPFQWRWVKELAEEKSLYGGCREGVVVSSARDSTRKGKWVSEQYHLANGR
jgi:RNA ligase (TIGR02306 family)